jgi:hypothetical protein
MSAFHPTEIRLLSEADLEEVNGGAVPSPAVLFAREVRSAAADAASTVAAADYALGMAVAYLMS